MCFIVRSVHRAYHIIANVDDASVDASAAIVAKPSALKVDLTRIRLILSISCTIAALFHDFLPNYNYKAVWSTRYSLGPRSMNFIQCENDRSVTMNCLRIITISIV